MIEQLEQVAARPVSRETFEKLEAYVAQLKEGNARQNLISVSTLHHIWARHILDSAQLVRFEPRPGASWVDIGSGAGLPGIVIACLVEGSVALVEPRRLRSDFLHKVVESLQLNVSVVRSRVERLAGHYDVITARAVSNLADILKISQHLSTRNTVWTLPKGRNAQSELAEAQRAWQGTFHLERSATDEDSWIIVGTGVRAKGR